MIFEAKKHAESKERNHEAFQLEGKDPIKSELTRKPINASSSSSSSSTQPNTSYDPIIQWFIDITQTEEYYLLDMSFMLITSWYLTTSGHSLSEPQSLFPALFTLSLSTTGLFFIYLSHKYYLRDNRIEMIIHRIISLCFNHFLQFLFSFIAIVMCLEGHSSNHVDDHQDTFYCFPIFIILNCIKLFWHLYSYGMFFYLRSSQTMTSLYLYLQMMKVGIVNIFQPFLDYEYLQKQVLQLMHEIDERQLIIRGKNPSLLGESNNQSNQLPAIPNREIASMSSTFIDDEIGKFPPKEFFSNPQHSSLTILSRITQTELYFMLDSFLILSSSWYTTFVGNMPKKLFTLLLILSVTSTVSTFLYISQKFYLRLNRSEALIHRTITLFFSHIVQMACITSIVLCSQGLGEDHIDDDRHHFLCSVNFIAVTYFKISWHAISILMSIFIRGQYTLLGLIAFDQILWVGLLNIFEIIVSWNYLEKKVKALHQYMIQKNQELQF